MHNEPRAMDISRREALNLLVGLGVTALAGAVCYPIISYVVPPAASEAAVTSVAAAKVNELAPDTGKIFKFGETPALLIMLPSGEMRAFSATCTHLGCIVQYRPDRKVIWCACHGGQFDPNNGTVIAGPPPAPLTKYKVAVQGDQIMVTRGGA